MDKVSDPSDPERSISMSRSGWWLRRQTLLVALFLTAALAAAVPVAAGASPAASEAIDIGAARQMPLGSVVTVRGSATVPAGIFASSSFDEGFAIQDRTGGIYVSVADNLGIALRQEVRVTGQLVDSFGLLTLVPAADADVTVLGRGREVEPRWVLTGRVGTANQGLLIEVFGVITQPVVPDPPFGSKVFVNDGSGELRVFVNTTTGIDTSGLAAGQLVRVIGFSSAFIDAEIDPRFQSDIRRPGLN
jgi:hypothetical protein